MRWSSRYCRSDSLGCLPRNVPLMRAMAMPPRVRRRLSWASNPAKVTRKHADLTVEPELLAHISPLGWAHILLTGEYRWPKRR